MIRLRLSKRTLRIVGWALLVPVVVAGLYGLGTWVTPRDANGSPLILSPSLRAAERYRRIVQGWVEEMPGIDQRLTALLSADVTSDPAELYAQGQEMQEIGEVATLLARNTQVAEVPVALVGLRERAEMVADAYVEAAVLAARWLSAPTEAGRTAALEALRAARALRMELEESRWLQKPNWTP
jgi:hypothetical protein